MAPLRPAPLCLLLLCLVACSSGIAILTPAPDPGPPPTVTVAVQWPGATAADVEEGLVLGLEAALQGVSGLARITSTSVGGSARIELEFAPHVVELEAVAAVRAALERVSAALPGEAGAPWTELGHPVRVGTVLVACAGPECPAVEELRRSILRLPGIARVVPRGHQVRSLAVELDGRRLLVFGLAVDRVIAALDPVPAADRDPEALSTVVLSVSADGTPVLLRDVADLYLEHRHPAGRAWLGDEPVVALDVLAADPKLDTAPVRAAAEAASARFVQASEEAVFTVAMPGASEELARVLRQVTEAAGAASPDSHVLRIEPGQGDDTGELRVAAGSTAADGLWQQLVATPGVEIGRLDATPRVVELLGGDREALRWAAADLESALVRLPGLERLALRPGRGGPELRIELHPAAAAAHGVDERGLARALRSVAGQTLDRPPGPTLEVRLMGLGDLDDPTRLTLLLPGPDGTPSALPLSQVARIEQVLGYGTLLRIDGRPALRLELTAARPGPKEADLLAAIGGVELPAGVAVRLLPDS